MLVLTMPRIWEEVKSCRHSLGRVGDGAMPNELLADLIREDR
jgi:hypothetical protein